MRFYLATVTHPDGEGGNVRLAAHAAYRRRLVHDGVRYASGPFKGTALCSGFLIVRPNDRAAIDQPVADDPFAMATASPM